MKFLVLCSLLATSFLVASCAPIEQREMEETITDLDGTPEMEIRDKRHRINYKDNAHATNVYVHTPLSSISVQSSSLSHVQKAHHGTLHSLQQTQIGIGTSTKHLHSGLSISTSYQKGRLLYGR